MVCCDDAGKRGPSESAESRIADISGDGTTARGAEETRRRGQAKTHSNEPTSMGSWPDIPAVASLLAMCASVCVAFFEWLSANDVLKEGGTEGIYV